MQVLVIEDEKLASDRLIKLIRQYNPSIQIMDVVSSIEGTVNIIEMGNKPDLIFMDIQLSDGNSFDIFDKCHITAPVIFTTAFSEYALKAFKIFCIDYLLKPVGQKELKIALDKYQYLSEGNRFLSIESIADVRTVSSQNYKNRFIVKSGIHLQTIPAENICCFFTMDKITFLSGPDNRKFTLDYSLDKLEALLDPNIFFRVSRQFIININSIKDIRHSNNNRLKILLINNNDIEIIVSRERVQDFKSWLDK
jgi:DNA-binding LytR/AlgR family response regulator